MRITTNRDIGGQVVLIAGRLDAGGVADLERVVAELSGPLHLELGDLRSADDAGVEALRALRARGIALTGVSPYFRLLLGVDEPGKAREPPSPPERRRGNRGAGRRRSHKP